MEAHRTAVYNGRCSSPCHSRRVPGTSTFARRRRPAGNRRRFLDWSVDPSADFGCQCCTSTDRTVPSRALATSSTTRSSLRARPGSGPGVRSGPAATRTPGSSWRYTTTAWGFHREPGRRRSSRGLRQADMTIDPRSTKAPASASRWSGKSSGDCASVAHVGLGPARVLGGTSIRVISAHRSIGRGERS